MFKMFNLANLPAGMQSFSEMAETPVEEAIEKPSNYMILLVDAIHDVEMGQRFIEDEAASNWGILPDDEAVLMDGPNNPYYMEVWDRVLLEARSDLGGLEWYLFQASNGLFMVRTDTPKWMLESQWPAFDRDEE